MQQELGEQVCCRLRWLDRGALGRHSLYHKAVPSSGISLQ